MSKRIKIMTVTLLLAVSLTLSFGAGCALGNGNLSSPDSALDVVEEAWSIIFQDYVDRDRLDAGTLSQGAINGMMEALDDPYSSYMDVEGYQMSINNLKGKFEGIGAYVGVRDEQIMIIAPIAGSPAVKAGIKAGDIILKIDGSSTAEMSLDEAVLNIRGPRGTTVRLLIIHQGEVEPEEIEITRAEIELPSVYFEMRENIAYIGIAHFTDHTSKELSSVLEGITPGAATGIILDLRSNPGGLLGAVVDVAGYFLGEGIVVSTVDNQGEKTALSVKPGGLTTELSLELPLVVLVDNYSASGSEVLAGALQDYRRATIAGTITYGKGSVNTLHRLKDGSGLYITTARWFTPDGRVIEGKGITPDYELEGEDAIQWAIDYLRGNI